MTATVTSRGEQSPGNHSPGSASAPGHLGRQPPHNLAAERSLLGAMMLSPAAIGEAIQRLDASDFYQPSHSHVFDAIAGLYAAGSPVDSVLVADQLSRNGLLDAIGGPGTLIELQGSAAAVSNAAHYAKVVEENALLRRLIATASEISELGFQPADDVAATMDTAESLIYRVAQRRVTDTLVPLRDLLGDTLDRFEQMYEQAGAVTGTPTGFTDLDTKLYGLQPGALIVMGARPAMGKTALALAIARNAALSAGKSAVYFSLEMSHLELTQRLVSMDARVDSSHLRNGKVSDSDWNRITRSLGRLGDADLWIDDNANLTVMELRAKARRLKSELGGSLGLIVVDYLQLMSGPGRAENRQTEIAEISRGLKVLAREIDTPVLALSQLSRSLEQRADKRPMLSDLRESGSIEQDADVVLFLYRDEVYNPDTPDAGLAELNISKHRAGPTGTCRLVFLPHHTLFENEARDDG
ncbi:MAG: replicative DNA helicase [Microthrixaceae bacterium]